ncbi:MAG: MoxR family ATPase [Candidatus Electryonea clarkiae]|nr:MoxR family ATPase [Candidatus Electryonea clarkiae]MDP8287502.1 MoxR family ATPase [Candidatus Electryonea clarkiae]
MNVLDDDLQRLERMAQARNTLRSEIGKVIIGQDEVIDQMLVSLFSRGHVLLVGVPGLAKTLLIRSLSKALNLKFNRIQFTPDLMPSDITGTEIIEENKATGKKEFRFVRGPLFAQIVLADEINRTPPKTQAALLQAMQEYEVSASGTTYKLEEPFFVLATQNPIEQEGTYPLPEAQLDRFMFNLLVDYPTSEQEVEIVGSTTAMAGEEPLPVIEGSEIIELQELVRRVPVAPNVLKHAVNLVRKTRPTEDEAPDYIKEWIRWGAGPRAGQYLILGAKARATLDGRPTPEVADIDALAHPVFRHRLVRTFRAEADGIDSDAIIDRLLENKSK